ncbi:hypothetical protein BpHYR1_026838 [Brachionus plicatilis]|uniref:Uncharacterized protein n=1 Tax=Brachionus plicatilis TaxID=10195 RepID=A0A3M7P8W2_BRAPC|nr:hypothetical protein BpHYR1_026838 [Brachionus plicatilis]
MPRQKSNFSNEDDLSIRLSVISTFRLLDTNINIIRFYQRHYRMKYCLRFFNFKEFCIYQI